MKHQSHVILLCQANCLADRVMVCTHTRTHTRIRSFILKHLSFRLGIQKRQSVVSKVFNVNSIASRDWLYGRLGHKMAPIKFDMRREWFVAIDTWSNQYDRYLFFDGNTWCFYTFSGCMTTTRLGVFMLVVGGIMLGILTVNIEIEFKKLKQKQQKRTEITRKAFSKWRKYSTYKRKWSGTKAWILVHIIVATMPCWNFAIFWLSIGTK